MMSSQTERAPDPNSKGITMLNCKPCMGKFLRGKFLAIHY